MTATGESNGVPRVISERKRLQQALPALYREQELTMRFVSAFERVLDPIAGLLDALPAHFQPDLAPQDVLELMAAWLGLEAEAALAGAEEPGENGDRPPRPDHSRAVVRHAAELARLRGTVHALELVLRLTFPSIKFKVRDSGGVSFGDTFLPQPASGEPTFVVECLTAADRETLAAVVACIERFKPAHATYKLRAHSGPDQAPETIE